MSSPGASQPIITTTLSTDTINDSKSVNSTGIEVTTPTPIPPVVVVVPNEAQQLSQSLTRSLSNNSNGASTSTSPLKQVISITNNNNDSSTVDTDNINDGAEDLTRGGSSNGLVSHTVSTGVPSGDRAEGRHLNKYKHYVESKLSNPQIKDEVSKEMVTFPADDITIKQTEQYHRTRESTLTGISTSGQGGSGNGLATHINMSIDSFREPRKTVVKNYAKYKKEAERMVLFDNDKYDCDIDRSIVDVQKQKGETDEVVSSHLKVHTPTTDSENSAARKKGRVGFFRYFRPDYNWGSGTEVSICNRIQQDIWSKQQYTNVLIELKGLVFMLGDLEPFFCSLYLYDATNKQRISESFYFDFNSEEIKALLSKQKEIAEPLTQSKHVIVSIPHKQQNDIWVVVRIAKVMQGDPDVIKEPYTKYEDKDVKSIKKNKAKVTDVVNKFCERLGRFTQPFCVSAIPLTDATGDIKHGVLEVDTLYKQVPKDQSDLDDLIDDIKDATKKKKLKVIPGTLSLNIVKPSNQLPVHISRLDPSLDLVTGNEQFNKLLSSSTTITNPTPLIGTSTSMLNLTTPVVSVAPPTITTTSPTISTTPPPTINVSSSSTLTTPTLLTPSSSFNSLSSSTLSVEPTTIPTRSNSISRQSNAVIPVIRELQCFPLKDDLLPYSDFINNLYLYPDTVNLSKASGRNICIKIEIRDSDLIAQQPLKIIYGKSSCQKFTSQYITETQYHTKTPNYLDEVKIKLPTQLTSKYHVLFSFYHIVCNKKKEKEETETLVGFSVLPLYNNRKFVDNGLIQLPLALGAPKDNYLRGNENDYSYLENGKNVFKLNLKLQSSIYPQNQYLNRFLLNSQDPNLTENDLNNILNEFGLFDPYESIKFLPVIVRQLINVICNREIMVGANAIKAIFVLLSKIQVYLDDSQTRTPLLASFVQNVFDIPKDTKEPVYSALCSRFVYFLMLKKNLSQRAEQQQQQQPSSQQQSTSTDEITNTTLFSFSWFIYDLIIKSLTLTSLENPDFLKGSREGKFDSEFIKYLTKLGSFIVRNFQSAVVSSTDGRLALEANNSLALFIKDLFSIFDRGISMDLVFTYIAEMNQGISTMTNESNITTMMFFKFDFLKIVIDYEHFIAINIPIVHTVNHIQTFTQKILDSHPLAGLLMQEVFNVINSPTSEVRGVALTTLSTLLIKNEYDSRYQSAEKRERIASIYLPLILWFIEHFEVFTTWYNSSSTDEKRQLIGCILFILKNMPKTLIKQWLLKEVPQRINVLFSIIDYCTNAFEYQPPQKSLPHLMLPPSLLPHLHNSAGSNTPSNHASVSITNSTPLSGIDTSSLNGSGGIPSTPTSGSSGSGLPLGSITKLLKKNSHKHEKGGSLILPPKTDANVYDLTHASSGNLSQLLASSATPTKSISSLAKEMMSAAASGEGGAGSGSAPAQTSGNGSPVIGHNISQMLPPLPPSAIANIPSTPGLGSDLAAGSRAPLIRSPSISRARPLSNNEPTLCSEANLIALDFLDELIDVLREQLVDPASPIIERLFTLLISLMKKRQSHRFHKAMFNLLKSFVVKFRNHFFRINNQFCGLLCQQVLHLCNSPTVSVRSDATAFLYILLKHNQQELGNIGRGKIQATIALSKLATGFGKYGAKFMERSLTTIALYASADRALEGSAQHLIDPKEFATMTAEQVESVVEKFHNQTLNMSTKLIKIIRDTLRVNQLKENSDPETIHELYSKIASGYSDTPIIRVDWLDSLATLHVEQENYFEAAICKIRIALLVHAYLEQHNLLPCRLDISLIRQIVPELEEIVIEEDEGVCTSPLFSVAGLLSSIILAINQFHMAESFEFAILLYKLVIPLCEKTRDYEKLSHFYKQVHELYEEILKFNENKSRMLGRYYRVGFYGKKFEELDGREFVYKEPKLTHLFALAERLKTFYREKLGEPVNIFPDSNRVEREKLEPEKLYLQITSLKTYFDPESEKRESYFERHTVLNKFVFITPFTLSGKTQGSITEQFHRKTVISIECTAPNMLKRYPITDYKETEISPIQNSIETINQRAKLLELEVNQTPVNVKTLQGVLQGSVLLQVNAGALEICRGFLSKPSRVNWPPHHIKALEDKCIEFLSLCERALTLNKRNIQMNQIGFHHELELGFKKLQQKMIKYVNNEINELADEYDIDTSTPDDEEGDSTNLTEESYDESIKESGGNGGTVINNITNAFESLNPSHLIPAFMKEGKKKSGLLTVKEDKKHSSRKGSSVQELHNAMGGSTNSLGNSGSVNKPDSPNDSPKIEKKVV